MENKYNVPTHDPQTGELNPYYEELTGEKNPLCNERVPKPRTLNEYRQSKEYGYTEPSPSKNNQTPPLLPLSESDWIELSRIQRQLFVEHGMRVGQSYMTALARVNFKLYAMIFDENTDIDCYYDDSKVGKLVGYLNV
jgi:hypothetical protein